MLESGLCKMFVHERRKILFDLYVTKYFMPQNIGRPKNKCYTTINREMNIFKQ